jgi:hypothetical protein
VIKKLRNLLIYTLILCFSTPALPLTLKLKNSRNLRNFDKNRLLVSARKIEKDTEVIIPDAYIDAHFKGDKSDEVAVLNWLASARSLPLRKYKETNTDRVRGDYFVPVIVKGELDTGWVSLRSLARKGGLELVTTEDTDYFSDEVIESPTPRIPTDQLETPSRRIDPRPYECYTKSQQAHLDIVLKLNATTNNIIYSMLTSINLKAQDDITNRGTVSHIINNFNKTCDPTEFKNFFGQLKLKAQQNNIPVDILLGLMTQESSGKCMARHDEQNGTASIGLFQLNTGTSPIKSCAVTPGVLINRSCLNNPYTNLEEAIRVLRQKFKRVNSVYPNKTHRDLVGQNKEGRDLWRKTLSAYNGGEGHVFQAYKDIEKFNSTYKTDLDPDAWEIRRIFMLRNAIEKRGGKILGPHIGQKYRRSTRNSLNNLSYVDSIIPSEDSLYNQGHSTRWSRYLDNAQ